ncbi:MAG: hypothetical protein R3305_01050 [Gammaproteobacteria bacterium]|nr:hypothetical protein [Gammaproteobacteria bacterium]
MLGFPTLIALHSVGMAVVVGISLMVTLRLNGIITAISAPLVPRLLTVAVWGFGLNLLTGLALFITRGPEYIESGIFVLKMGLVLVSASILFWLRRYLLATAPPTETKLAGRFARGMAAAATAAWFGAVVTGRLIAYLSSLYR